LVQYDSFPIVLMWNPGVAANYLLYVMVDRVFDNLYELFF
jgi:hypothetical protein